MMMRGMVRRHQGATMQPQLDDLDGMVLRGDGWRQERAVRGRAAKRRRREVVSWVPPLTKRAGDVYACSHVHAHSASVI
jgi:hypothetical protein